jgi:hypothetical protein
VRQKQKEIKVKVKTKRCCCFFPTEKNAHLTIFEMGFWFSFFIFFFFKDTINNAVENAKLEIILFHKILHFKETLFSVLDDF